jgi:hypothetical protein
MVFSMCCRHDGCTQERNCDDSFHVSLPRNNNVLAFQIGAMQMPLQRLLASVVALHSAKIPHRLWRDCLWRTQGGELYGRRSGGVNDA